MINQIASVPQKTTRLGLVTNDLLQAHNLQARVRDRAQVAEVETEPKPETGLVSSPLTGMPFLVPILRWID